MSDQEVELIIKARDEATATLKKISDALGVTQKETKKASEAAAASQSSFAKMAGAVGLGTIAADAAMSAYGSLTGFLKGTVSAAAEAQAGQAQLAAVLTSTGGAAGVTAVMANELASSLAKTTTFTDDQILSAENLALTFTGISKDVFPAFIQNVLDVSTAMGQDLNSSVIQLGKALNDPIEGISALTRVGVNFTEQQKKQIETLVKSGKTLEAQKIIVQEMNKEFGGSAAAAANTYDGQMKRLNNTVGEIQENIGMKLLPGLTALSTAFLTVANAGMDATAEGNNYLKGVQEIIDASRVQGLTHEQTQKKLEDYAEQQRQTAAGANNLSTTFYDMVQASKAVAHGMLQMVFSMAGWAVALGGAIYIWGTFVVDVIQGFWKMLTSAKDILPKIGEAIVLGLAGKADEAKALLSSVVKDSFDFTDTKNAAAGVWAAAKPFFDEANKEGEKARAAFDQINTRSNYKPAFLTPANAPRNLGGGGPGGADATKKAKEQKELAEKLKQLWFDLGKLGDKIKDDIADAKQKTEEWLGIVKMQEDAYASLGVKLTDAGISVAGITDQTKVLERSHEETMKSLISDMQRYGDQAVDAKNKVTDIGKEIEKLKSDQDKALAANSKETIAAAVEEAAKLQQKLEDAKKTLAEAGTYAHVIADAFDTTGKKVGHYDTGIVEYHKPISDDEKDQLNKTIAETNAILNKQAQFVKDNDAEIKKARDLANMDDIAKTIELGRQKEEQIKAEYASKIAAAEAEQKLEQTKYDTAIAMLKESNEKIKVENEAAKKDYAKYLLANSDLSNSYIQTEINKYNQLAMAIQNSAKGTTTKFTPEESALLAAYKKDGAAAADAAQAAASGSAASVQHRANGGVVMPGQPYMVGENGPEMFMPQAAGSILPSGSNGAIQIHIMEGASVSVANRGDIDSLADVVAQRLARVLQSQRSGLATAM